MSTLVDFIALQKPTAVRPINALCCLRALHKFLISMFPFTSKQSRTNLLVVSFRGRSSPLLLKAKPQLQASSLKRDRKNHRLALNDYRLGQRQLRALRLCTPRQSFTSTALACSGSGSAIPLKPDRHSAGSHVPATSSSVPGRQLSAG